MESFSTAIPGSGLGLLPGAGSDPSYLDVYGSGIPGDTSGVSGGLSVQQTTGNGSSETEGGYGLSSEGLEMIDRVFREMGEMLSDDAVTADFGSSLEAGDYSDAAEDLASLSENIDRTSTETRQNLAAAFDYGARELYLSEFAEISGPLEGAATALEEGGIGEMRDGLDMVYEMLSSFEVRETGVYAREETSEPEPEIERMSGEGEELELETPEDVSDLLVAPGTGVAGTGEALSGTVDLTGSTSSSAEEYSQTYYDYGWDEKDVVSKYFSPR
jgi:hypothetical protein